MEPAIYARIRKIAVKIASRFPADDFYQDFAWAVNKSRRFFDTDPVLGRIKGFVSANLDIRPAGSGM